MRVHVVAALFFVLPFLALVRLSVPSPALEQGLIQEKVAAVRAEHEKAVARRRDVLTGTSNFPDLAEAAVAVLDVPRVTQPPYPAAITFDALP